MKGGANLQIPRSAIAKLVALPLTWKIPTAWRITRVRHFACGRMAAPGTAISLTTCLLTTNSVISRDLHLNIWGPYNYTETFSGTLFPFSRLKGEAWFHVNKWRWWYIIVAFSGSVSGNVWHGLPRRWMDCDTEKGWRDRWFPKALVWLSGWIWWSFRSSFHSPLFFSSFRHDNCVLYLCWSHH